MPFSPSPQEFDPNAVVENRYPTPSSQITDEPSADNMEEFLWDRMDRANERRILGHGGTATVFTPGTESRWGFDRWRYLPPVEDGRGWRRATVIGLLGINAVINIGNIANLVDDTVEEIVGLGDAILDGIHERGDIVCVETGGTEEGGVAPSILRETTTTVREREVSSIFLSHNEVGQSDPDEFVIELVLNTLSEAQSDSSIDKVELEIFANTSDEWNTLQSDFAEGRIDADNLDLGRLRLGDFSEQAQSRAKELGIDLSEIEVSLRFTQDVLSAEDRSFLDDVAIRHGFEDRHAARLAFDNEQELDSELQAAMSIFYGAQRSTQVKVTTFEADETTTTSEQQIPGIEAEENTPPDECEPLTDKDPEDENHDYDWRFLPFVWPALPWWVRREVETMIPTIVDLPGFRDPQRLLIHEDGIDENNQLIENAWAYVRKYLYLFREDGRIQKILEHEFEDADGETQTLRAVFVDHNPTDESQEMVNQIFAFASHIDGGRFAKNSEVVVIYPSDNVGIHGDPKQVGMGLDIQEDENLLGFAIAGLGGPQGGLIEMYMPKEPTKEQLDGSMHGAAWTLAHELVGHLSDVTDEPNVLNPVGTLPNGKQLYTLPPRFADSGQQVFEQASIETTRANQDAGNRVQRLIRRIIGRQRGGETMRWTVRRGRQQLESGQFAEPVVQEIEGVEDARLSEAVSLIKETGNVSEYGRTHAAEDYAEAAAGKATGITVPLSEAPDYPARNVHAESEHFTDGYLPSQNWQNHLNDRWDSQDFDGEFTHFPPIQRAEPRIRIDDPENFQWAQRLAEAARALQIQEPEHHQWSELVVDQII